ncbi:hypothetical protein K458DRAFT_15075 [Lentithecium fluviatile CBS 122367]|uniref:WSC domain-containing protein n=1 Tax=Lentithecium fluviatile CBS 122367 TaxID=1168545 RepID=A0A6G1J5X3_9PLEO|nr:hypothetical protein K458DRAFT_15075 [Lentithecium fluviatile CBS 122367]
MLSIRFVSALAATASLLSVASAESSSMSASKVVTITEPTTTLPASAMETIGCFATGVPLEDHGSGEFASPGKCQLICLQLNKNILGLSEGTNCWCGDLVPPESTKTDNSSCSTTCSGTDKAICGGKKKLWVMTTGKDRNPFEYADEDILSSSSSSAAPSSTSTSAPADSATASPTSTQEPEKKKSNTVGIAVGVVVGVVALLAIIGGVFFWLRQKKRREVEEEYRRQAAVNSFVSGGKLHTSNSSMTDSRLDPDFMNRRQSNGSIADNEDYSRRILKVTNA